MRRGPDIAKKFCRVTIAAAGLCAIAPYAAADVCTLEPGPTRTVARILDGETVVLDDGREARLIGALAPRAEDAGAATDTWPPETAAIRLLTDLVLGHSVRLAFGERRSDRYGRHLAHLFVTRGGEDTWVQGELLARGAARAYGLPGSFDCTPELLAHERVARDKHLGIWSMRFYRPIAADKTALLLKRRSRFEIVRGTVKVVARTRSAVYLNFGEDWKSDFTARIGKTVAAAQPDFNTTLDALKGREIEVRGWIERRNGPLIDVTDPGQVTVLPNDTDEGGRVLSERRGTGSAVAPARGNDGGDVADKPNDDAMPRNEKRPADPKGSKPGALNL